MDKEEWSSERFLALSRFWVQQVLVPIIVVIGVIGNLITVIILTRKRMKCSTNVYLTALAIADLIYLLFVFILSFEHYNGSHSSKFLLYWRFYGLTHWIVDAASYISIWLTVSFTVERYIAVCHPIRGKMFCTENRAKRVIIGVCIFCILSTITTSFEYEIDLKPKTKLIKEEEKKPCINSTESYYNDQVNTTEFIDLKMINASFTENLINMTLDENNIMDKSSQSIPNQLTNESIPFNYNNNNKTNNCIMNNNINISNNQNMNNNSNISTIDTSLMDVYPQYSNLGKNELYKTIFYWFTCITFVFVPLILLATFNCFLINAVHRSQITRNQMTNSQERSSATQENRITITLIAVVILFLVCQSPTAGMLVYTTVHQPKLHTTEDNIIRGLGNVFNLMVNLNAACNFLLYCALSDKYRRTFKAVFMGERWGSTRHDTLYTSSLTMSRRFPSATSTIHHHTSGPHYHLANGTTGLKRNISAYAQRNIEAERLKRIARTKSMLARPLHENSSTNNTYY